MTAKIEVTHLQGAHHQTYTQQEAKQGGVRVASSDALCTNELIIDFQCHCHTYTIGY